MRVIMQAEYGAPGDVLACRQVATPQPAEGEVLVEVRAAGVQAGDWHTVRGTPYVMRLMGFGLRRPKQKVPGNDVAGIVAAVGRGVAALDTGDEVFGWCTGAFAEYAAVPASALTAKPAGITFEQASVVPSSAFTALQGLRDHGNLAAGQRVLINGASGGVGPFAVQIAKTLGAHVTAVCSTRNVAMVRSLGADRVVDYTAEDITAGEERFDLMLDVAAGHPLASCRRVLTPSGTYVLIGDSGGRWVGGLSRFVTAKAQSPFVGQTMTSFVAHPNQADLAYLAGLLEAGAVTPVVERTYPLAETPQAIAYVEQGHARAKVTIVM